MNENENVDVVSTETTTTENATEVTNNATVATTTTVSGVAKVTWHEAIGKFIVEFQKATFKGFAADAAGILQEGDINEVSFIARYFKAVAFDSVDNLAVLAAIKKDTGVALGNSTIATLLSGAAVTIKRTRFSTGDEYVDANGVVMVHANDGYNTEFVSVRPSAPKAAIIEKMMLASF